MGATDTAGLSGVDLLFFASDCSCTMPSSSDDAKRVAEMATATRKGLRATRRQNLAVACSVAGSQSALAAKISSITGSAQESARAQITRILSDDRAMSEGFAMLLEIVMEWEPYSASTVWRERRKAPRVPRTWHDLDSKVEPLG